MKKTVSGITTLYHYDYNNNLIAETAANGTPLRDIIYQNGERVAMKVYGVQEGMYYFLNDHLGTPQTVISSSGVIVWEAAYMPFGKAWVITETVVNNFRFPGQYYDEETGLHYNWHRYYNPNTGRYLTPDPIGGINLYYYVRNNPANLIDPTGEIPVDTIWDAINIIYDIATGDWKSLAADSAAIVIPYVPAGLTKVNKVCKIGKALKYGISADEIRAINKSLGGVTELTGDASSIIAAAERYEGFWNKTAAMVREIAGRHMFNDANKRTAQAVVQELMKRNKISTGVSSGEMRKVINQVARGELKEVSDIAKALTLQRHLADNCLKS